MNKIYKEDSTKHIDPRSFTRMRPGTYCGSTEYSTQLIREAFANALDEHNIGHGINIYININSELNEYTIIDEGQGFIPNAPRPNGETMMSECFSVINTSGKYDDSDESIYGGSALGLNGIGCKLICYLSLTSMISSSDGKGKRETVWYKDGLFAKRELTDEALGVHGTTIKYIPDPQFFQHKEANLNELQDLFEEISALCPALYIHLNDKTFHSANGLNDLIDRKVKDKEILSKRFNSRIEDGNNLIDMCLTYTSNYTEDITSYVNYGYTENGVHLTTLRSNLTRVINKYANANDLFKKGEDNLTGAELSEGLTIVFNLKAKKVAYDSQSKVRVVDIDKTLLNRIINEDFVFWMENNPKDVKIIVERALNARKAREAAKKARENVRNNTEKKKKALKFDSKLADCNSKDRLKCEIFVTEGDSASGNLKLARNNEFQAVLPVRGKILNVRKATLDKIQKNAEIMTMIDAFGLSVDPKTMKLTFRPEDLRYGKIIIMSDADVDGAHIKNLFYTFIWTFCPELIKQGYVYAGIPPLYRVTETKDKYVYLKDDVALDEYRKTHPNKKLTLTRMKGLGEMDKAETSILVDPGLRLINQVTVEDAQAADKLFDDLMGEAVLPRKLFIKEHSAEATYQI